MLVSCLENHVTISYDLDFRL